MERIDDLEINGYKIYQDTDKFCFGIDAVLLANFSLKIINQIKNKNVQIADLCTGNIPIPLILYAKNNIDIHIDAYDIDEYQIELAKKSINYNKKNDSNIVDNINLINIDIKKILNDKKNFLYLYNKYDLITCNPPYIKNIAGQKNINDNISNSKHELNITFDEICQITNLLLKSNKNFCLVHRTNRLSEIIWTMKKYKLEPKKIQFVYPNINKQSNLVLIHSVKCAKEETTVLEPIIVFNENNEFTEKVLKIYGK